SLRVTNRRSGQPSRSASKMATPEPRVSGRSFLPARPLLWTKRIPAVRVTSVKRTAPEGAAGAAGALSPLGTAAKLTVARTAAARAEGGDRPPGGPPPPAAPP